MPKRLAPAIGLACALLCAPAFAATTIQSGVPVANAPLTSVPIRDNFAAAANDIDNLQKIFSGPSAPASPYQFQLWENTAASPPALEQYDGADWVAIGEINPSTHVWQIDPAVLASTSITLTNCASGTGLGTVSALLDEPINPQTGTSYSLATTDQCREIVANNSSGVALTLLAPATAGASYWFDALNIGTGSVTLTPASGTINGQPSITLNQYQAARITTDGTNYFAGSTSLGTLLTIQTETGASYAFGAGDMQKETRRSNSGGAMTDTFPASGMVAGSRITVTNVDASATDTITAGAGTTISGASTFALAPSRAAQFAYDLGSTEWRCTLNTCDALLPSNVGTAAAKAANGTGSAVPTIEGATTAGHGALFNSDGSFSDAGSAPGSGTVTSVGAGTGLNGGPITSTGTLNCNTISSSAIGCGEVDGTSIVAPGGIMSAPSAGIPQGRLTLQSGSTLPTTQEASYATPTQGVATASYAPGDTVTPTGGTAITNAVLTVTNTNVESVAVLVSGTTAAGVAPGGDDSQAPGYQVGDDLTLAGGTFSGSLIAYVATTQVNKVAAGSNGTGCTNGTYTVTLSSGTGTKATFSATVSSNVITSITLLTGGSYTTGPQSNVGNGYFIVTGVTGCSTQPSVEIAMGVLTVNFTGAGGASTGVFTVNASSFTSTDTGTQANGNIGTQTSAAGATFTPLFQPNAVSVSTIGIYSAIPSNPVAQGSSSGSGLGATFTVYWGVGTVSTSVYYQPFGTGQNVPVWNGTNFVSESIGSGLTLALDSNTGHTGYQASGDVYDLFVALNSGTLELGTGPAWSSATARGTGASTTQLALENGIWTNAVSITLRFGSASGNTISVTANEATYVGSLYASANGTVRLDLGCFLVPGGFGNVVGLYNAYNRMRTPACSEDATAAWSYSTATWRSADNSAANRIAFLDGLGATPIGGSYNAYGTGGQGTIGIDLDSTSATPTLIAEFNSAGENAGVDFIGAPVLGLHFLQAVEHGASLAAFGGLGTQWLRANLDN